MVIISDIKLLDILDKSISMTASYNISFDIYKKSRMKVDFEIMLPFQNDLQSINKEQIKVFIDGLEIKFDISKNILTKPGRKSEFLSIQHEIKAPVVSIEIILPITTKITDNTIDRDLIKAQDLKGNKRMMPYLESNNEINSDDEDIKKIATGLQGSNLIDTIVNVVTYTYNEIEYNIYYSGKRKNAKFTYLIKEGVCYEISNLTSAIFRTIGIPTKMISGYMSNEKGEMQGHAWIEIMINGEWYAIDPTNNQMENIGVSHIKMDEGRILSDPSFWVNSKNTSRLGRYKFRLSNIQSYEMGKTIPSTLPRKLIFDKSGNIPYTMMRFHTHMIAKFPFGIIDGAQVASTRTNSEDLLFSLIYLSNKYKDIPNFYLFYYPIKLFEFGGYIFILNPFESGLPSKEKSLIIKIKNWIDTHLNKVEPILSENYKDILIENFVEINDEMEKLYKKEYSIDNMVDIIMESNNIVSVVDKNNFNYIKKLNRLGFVKLFEQAKILPRKQYLKWSKNSFPRLHYQENLEGLSISKSISKMSMEMRLIEQIRKKYILFYGKIQTELTNNKENYTETLLRSMEVNKSERERLEKDLYYLKVSLIEIQKEMSMNITKFNEYTKNLNRLVARMQQGIEENYLQELDLSLEDRDVMKSINQDAEIRLTELNEMNKLNLSELKKGEKMNKKIAINFNNAINQVEKYLKFIKKSKTKKKIIFDKKIAKIKGQEIELKGKINEISQQYDIEITNRQNELNIILDKIGIKINTGDLINYQHENKKLGIICYLPLLLYRSRRKYKTDQLSLVFPQMINKAGEFENTLHNPIYLDDKELCNFDINLSEINEILIDQTNNLDHIRSTYNNIEMYLSDIQKLKIRKILQ